MSHLKKYFMTIPAVVLICSCSSESANSGEEDSETPNSETISYNQPTDTVQPVNLKKKSDVRIPNDAISGDFDGDGEIEHLWVYAKMDSDEYATTPFKLKSEYEDMTGLSWDATRGVLLINAGQLNNDGCDYLLVESIYDSSWGTYSLYKYVDGKWKKAISDVHVYDADEDYNYVKKSSKDGYVVVEYNNGDGDPETDEMWQNKTKTVKLKY